MSKKSPPRTAKVTPRDAPVRPGSPLHRLLQLAASEIIRVEEQRAAEGSAAPAAGEARRDPAPA